MSTIRGRDGIRSYGHPSHSAPRPGEPAFTVAHRLANEEWYARVVRDAEMARQRAGAPSTRCRNRIWAAPRGVLRGIASLCRVFRMAGKGSRRSPSGWPS
jgi:hypothetical protein